MGRGRQVSYPACRQVLFSIGTIQGCHGQGKISGKWNFFQVREFCGWSGKSRKDLESQGKVREFGNEWLWHTDSRKFIYSVQEGKICTFSWDSLNPSSCWLGLLFKEKICSLGEQILCFKSNLQIWSDTVSTIKLKSKHDFFYLSEGMKSCKLSGKNQRRVREFWGGL